MSPFLRSPEHSSCTPGVSRNVSSARLSLKRRASAELSSWLDCVGSLDLNFLVGIKVFSTNPPPKKLNFCRGVNSNQDGEPASMTPPPSKPPPPPNPPHLPSSPPPAPLKVARLLKTFLKGIYIYIYIPGCFHVRLGPASFGFWMKPDQARFPGAPETLGAGNKTKAQVFREAPCLLTRCRLLVGIHRFWREHPPNNRKGLRIWAQRSCCRCCGWTKSCTR